MQVAVSATKTQKFKLEITSISPPQKAMIELGAKNNASAIIA